MKHKMARNGGKMTKRGKCQQNSNQKKMQNNPKVSKN